MLWNVFFCDRFTVAVLYEKQKAEAYCVVLNNYLYFLMGLHLQRNQGVLFQRDYTQIHTAHLARELLRFKFLCFIG